MSHPYEPGKADQIRRKVRNQRLIAENFAPLPAAKPDRFEGIVKGLIDKMLAYNTQQEAVYAFQKLDPGAAPSIIRLVNDRRPLMLKHTQFRNTASEAFEGILHDRPKVAIEAFTPAEGWPRG